MIFAVFWSALCIGRIISSFTKLGEDTREFREKLKAINAFMSARSVSQDLQIKVRRYLGYKFKMRKIINANLDLLNHLSPWLRLELTDHLYRQVITKHQFF